MRRYNKQQVMKDAHRLYGSEFHRKGRSWSECLSAAWGWEHDAVRARGGGDGGFASRESE